MHLKRWIAVGTLVGALALTLSLVFVAAPQSATAGYADQARRFPGVSQSSSTNWSGYAVAASQVTDVKGSWVVPSVTGTKNSRSYSSIWVGIDGYSSNSVEQIGTDQDWTGKSASYYAWYEMYPAAMVSLSSKTYPVSPGDTLNADASYASGQFVLKLNNQTKGWTFTTSQTLSSAARSSAEWVVEAPSSIFGVLPLANFGTAHISGASATINGTTSSPSKWAYDPITMVTKGGAIKAQPSPLSPDGSSFSVAWHHK